MAASRRPRDAHDRLSKRVFGRKRAFAVELRRVLPKELLAHLDPSTLRRYSTEQTDERLRGRISDLCFTADLVDGEQRRQAYFPLEHHSTFAGLLPLRAITCAAGLWHEHLADHPKTRVLPLVVPIVFTQPPARNTPTQLSEILDVPPRVLEVFPSPIEVKVYADDLSGSVLDDPEADPATLALVELSRAFLHAYGNPGSLTKERLAELAPLFNVLLDQREPLATNDVRALLTYVLRAFEEGSPVRELVLNAIRGRPRAMFVSIADSLVAKGRKAGLSEGRQMGLARAVLRLLARRFPAIPTPIRKRVSSSRDEYELLRWFDRAVTASSVEGVFHPDDE
jgi:Putative transposase, YhgA-like